MISTKQQSNLYRNRILRVIAATPGGRVRISRSRLSTVTNINEKTLRENIKALEREGRILVEYAEGGNKSSINTYVIVKR